jgi:hypothetical protein
VTAREAAGDLLERVDRLLEEQHFPDAYWELVAAGHHPVSGIRGTAVRRPMAELVDAPTAAWGTPRGFTGLYASRCWRCLEHRPARGRWTDLCRPCHGELADPAPRPAGGCAAGEDRAIMKT